ncbi:damage-inducible protein CinA [Maritimibacter sp. 55A14]|uniref:CinA family protein n=1 Tax=Maritimibacter sp. 55A14 TaxID=2174844 RepID=UPI000D607D73|nr:CinA family protein [Maritimibacter sp. 55A14]PWE33144.1 damage-inducible protein CinA [Maritimibacter sp. 55A14]
MTQALARDLLETARTKGLMVATAESCTGGMIAAAITDIAGSSDIFERGFVTYSNIAKVEMLGVSGETLSGHGAVSEAVAREMAEGALARSAAQLAVAVTGIAGPGGSDDKPEGRVCFALARDGAAIFSETRDFGPLGRAKVREATVLHALTRLLEGAHAAS